MRSGEEFLLQFQQNEYESFQVWVFFYFVCLPRALGKSTPKLIRWEVQGDTLIKQCLKKNP